jgi:steroid delta-isomerase-like uncharacterized protein
VDLRTRVIRLSGAVRLEYKKRMTIEEHRRALERMNELINAHDLSYIDELYADDVVWWYVGMPEPERGREALRARDTATARAFENLHREVEAMVIDEHGAAVRWRLTATHTGEYSGVRPTGRRIEMTGCTVFEFAAGLVQRLFVYSDITAVARQLGASS